MKKIFTSILMVGLCTLMSAQSVLNINGNVTFSDSEPIPGIFISLYFDSNAEPYVTETNEEGYFEISVDLTINETQGCFELFMLDCDFESVIFGDCYFPGNMDFSHDFAYCMNGTEDCHTFIVTEIIDSSLVLSAESFGIPPFMYVWSDGSIEEDLTLPLNTVGIYCVDVIDSQGCAFETCIDLTPPNPCFVTIFEEYSFNSIILYAEGYGQTNQVEYVWSTGETGETISVTESGDYCVTISDNLGCSSVDCRYVELDSTMIEDCFSYIYLGFTGQNEETLFAESFGVAPFTHVWTFNDSIVSTSEFYVPETQGVYCVVVTDAEDCASSSCYEYFEWEECGVWIGCDPVGNGVQLWAFGYGAEPLEYTWSNGDVNQELIVYENGEYCVTVSDSEGCSSTACVNVVLDDVSECFAPIEVVEFPDYVELTINPITDGAYGFLWNIGELTSSITVYESGVYCVEVVELETGCAFSTCVEVYVGGQEECHGWIETEYSGDSSAILSAFAVDIANDSMGYQYLWSTGEVTETIEVSEEGEYCLTIFGSNECIIETCTEVVFWDFPWQNSIFGVVYESETGVALDASVDIYRLLDNGGIELYSQGNQTLDGGFFVAENIQSGSYIALATAYEEGYVPTYGYNTTSWESAVVYEAGEGTSAIPLEISMISITNLLGDGTIEGTVTSQNITTTKQNSGPRDGSPVEGANIILVHSEVPVGQIFTDDEGNYKFTNLPFGEYDVILEIPGQARKVVKITLSAENPNVTGVLFESEELTGTHNISALSSLTLSPNPTSNTLVIDTYFEETRDVVYSIIDINGKTLEASEFKANKGENTLQLDVTSMQAGVYNLVLQSNDELIAKRFIKL